MLYRRFMLIVLLLTFVGFAACSSEVDVGSMSEEELTAYAGKIHQSALTLDSHVDIPGTQYATDELDPGINNPELKCDLVKMNSGGMDGVFLAVYVGQRPELNEAGFNNAHKTAIEMFAAIGRLFEMYPDRCENALAAADVERIAATGKRVIIIGIENGYPLGEEISNVEKFYGLGARYITLSHSAHNQICDSSGRPEPLHGGLSEFGKQVVTEMNRLGIMIDVSHIAVSSFNDVIELSEAPIIASHSGCFELYPHDRNLNDDQLRALTDNGGVIQIVALGAFLKQPPQGLIDEVTVIARDLGFSIGPQGIDFAAATEEQRVELFAKWTEISKKYPKADVSDYVDHIDHAVKIAGIDHVGIGTDFDGGGGIEGFDNHAEALNVTIELVRRGYTEEQIKKIWGENLMRVWKEVENISSRLNSN